MFLCLDRNGHLPKYLLDSVALKNNRSMVYLATFKFYFMILLLLHAIVEDVNADLREEYPIIPWEDLWEELDEMTLGKDFCRLEDSYCTFNDTSKDSTSNPSVRCYCDDDCVRYGDCCRDKAEADWGDGREEGSSRYSCRKMQTMSTVGALMVESCMAGYADKTIESLCQQQAPDSAYSYILDLPVTSKDTNISYVNIHCAVCNNDAANLHQWNITINCRTAQIAKEFSLSEFMAEALYFPGQRRWQRFTYRSNDRVAYQNQYNCMLEVVEFANETEFALNYGGRLCMFPKSTCTKDAIGRRSHCREQVRHCNPAWPNHLDRDKCHRYSYYVTHRNENNQETIYKNPHCALCNFVNVSSSNFKCISTRDMEILKNKRKPPSFKTIPVFSALMDFQSKDCMNENEMWDPIHMKCQQILCGFLFKLFNGHCVRDEKALAKLKNSSVIDNDCPKSLINEYIPRENGSVFVNSTKQVYANGFYEIVNNTHILICTEDYHYISKFSDAHKYLTVVVLGISTVCLALHIAIYISVPRCRNLPGKNLFSLACCLFIAHILYLTGTGATFSHGLCVFVSAALHYFWMASFCWMNVMSVDVCRTFTSQVHRGDLNSQKTYICYSIYAWGIPALVIALSLIFDFIDIADDYRPEYGTDYCWINNLYGLVLFFVLPVGAIVLENIVLYFVTVCCICKQARAARYAGTRSQSIKETKAYSGDKNTKIHKQKKMEVHVQNPRNRKDRVRLLLYVKLGVIQGLTWLLGFLAAFAKIPLMWYFFTVFNGLQGAFIFIGFDMKKKVRESVWETFTGKPWKKHQSSKNTTNTFSLPASTHTHSRSSKSGSDSEGDNPLDTSTSHLIIGKGNKLSLEDASWPGTDKTTKSNPNLKLNQNSAISYHSGSASLNRLMSPQENRTYPGIHVRNGDLRGSVVKGRFDDETFEDFSALPRIHADAEMKEISSGSKRKKAELQRIIDHLQQLHQTKNSSDLQVILQQLLERNVSSPEEKFPHQVSGGNVLPPFPDQIDRLADKLKCASQDSDGSIAGGYIPSLSVKSSKETVSSQPYALQRSSRPKSLLSRFPDDASRGFPTQHYSSMERLPSRHSQRSEISARMPTPQSFSQVSQVALAAVILQRAAAKSKARKQDFAAEEMKKYRKQKISSIGIRDTETPCESLV